MAVLNRTRNTRNLGMGPNPGDTVRRHRRRSERFRTVAGPWAV